jgi:hypothetical protein
MPNEESGPAPATRRRHPGPVSDAQIRLRPRGGRGRDEAPGLLHCSKYRSPAACYQRLNWLGVLLTSLGLAPRDAVTLQVRGRTSGKTRRIPILRTRLHGSDYLVALAGESQWVRNLRAAHGSAVIRRRRTWQVRLQELGPADGAKSSRHVFAPLADEAAPRPTRNKPATTSASTRRPHPPTSRPSSTTTRSSASTTTTS